MKYRYAVAPYGADIDNRRTHGTSATCAQPEDPIGGRATRSVILMLADGESYSTIEAAIPCYRDYINRWRRQFLPSRVEGLGPRYCGSTPTVLTPAMEARVLEKTRQAPPDDTTH
jgi:hypothetical protein